MQQSRCKLVLYLTMTRRENSAFRIKKEHHVRADKKGIFGVIVFP